MAIYLNILCQVSKHTFLDLFFMERILLSGHQAWERSFWQTAKVATGEIAKTIKIIVGECIMLKIKSYHFQNVDVIPPKNHAG